VISEVKILFERPDGGPKIHSRTLGTPIKLLFKLVNASEGTLIRWSAAFAVINAHKSALGPRGGL
jgi:hypothetical protein